jgi:L-asparaginase II
MPALARPNPVLVELTRGDIVESVHRGAVAVCDAGGRVKMSLGDIRRDVYPRSAFKMMQALPLIESGAADAFRLTPKDLALACASHGGEAYHVKTAASVLAKIGCKTGDLVCGPHRPYDLKSADRMVRAGEKPTRLHNNCSGKHAGFLCCAVHTGQPVKGYDQITHPVQVAARQAIADLCGIDAGRMPVGTDGCGAPNFALSLRALATGFARLADPARLSYAREAAARRLMKAVTENPLYESGTGTSDVKLMADAVAGTMTKVGAEGVHAAAIPALGLGVVVKADDGTGRAAETAMAAILVQLGALPKASKAAAAFVNVPVRNWRGDVCGMRRPADALNAL